MYFCRKQVMVKVQLSDLKVHRHKIFFLLFSWCRIPLGLDYVVKRFLNFYEYARRYSFSKIYHRCQMSISPVIKKKYWCWIFLFHFLWIPLGWDVNIMQSFLPLAFLKVQARLSCFWFFTNFVPGITGVNDSSDRFMNGVNDTSCKFITGINDTAINLWLVSTTPVINL